MSKKGKDFYVWALQRCIKSNYEFLGLDMMSMYNCFKENFPNATSALHKMYANLEESDFYQYDFDEFHALTFDSVHYVYEALSNLIPSTYPLLFDVRTRALAPKYKGLNIGSFGDWENICRLDLLMATMLFAEEFILLPITSNNVILTDTKLIVHGNFVTFKVSKHNDRLYVSIRIRGVILLEYVIQV